MSKGRMEAFSDGVLAIIITIMILELKVPHGSDLLSLRPPIPAFLSYVLSFVYLGIYWNNHHHLLQASRHVTGGVLWANLHLLFWLSLIPISTAWMGENHTEQMPVALYGMILLLAGVAYWILAHSLIRSRGKNSTLANALGRDFKGWISIVIYAIAIPLAFLKWWLAFGLYVLVAVMWLVPDRRIEAKLDEGKTV